jgi:nitrous oxidase accessory protein
MRATFPVAAAMAICFALSAGVARAERIAVAPGSNLQQAIDAAQDGDVLALSAGEHAGPVRITRAIELVGEGAALVRGDGRGSVIDIVAPGVIVRNLTIEGSGRDWTAMDAGVFVEQTAVGARLENNRLDGNLYGVYLHGAPNSIARGNTILGIRHGRVNEMGNGVSVWNAPGAQVIDNDISFGRDGVFSISSSRNVYRGNRFKNVRFAIHYMYTNDSQIADNVSTGNVVGFALMFSNRLDVTGNISDHDRDQGFLFNYANESTIEGNAVFGGPQPAARWASTGLRSADDASHRLPAEEQTQSRSGATRIGPERCVFI